MTDKRLLESARQRVEDSGDRVTEPRVRALGVLMAARSALSHHEIEKSLVRLGPVDRVTLYRVLDWLVEKGLAHRVSGADRAWRYSVATDVHRNHAHFQCNLCGKLLCLDEVPRQAVHLPTGFRSERIEVTVQGRCPECV
jgi:Fur family ferric uptake transcriptional regulator